MYRFFENAEAKNGDIIRVEGENFHHITRVLRIGDREEFEILINRIVYRVRIEEFSKKHIDCKILNEREDNNESKLAICLYQGLPKSDKLELIIQKCIELGVVEIVPFISARTIVKLDEKKEEKKLERYRQIAEAASKQAKRGIITEIGRAISFEDLEEVCKHKPVILAYENYGRPLRSVLNEFARDFEEGTKSRNINIIVGPEGGFEEKEVLRLKEVGAKIVNLGNRILRTETAAIAMTAMVQYELGDINEEV